MFYQRQVNKTVCALISEKKGRGSIPRQGVSVFACCHDFVEKNVFLSWQYWKLTTWGQSMCTNIFEAHSSKVIKYVKIRKNRRSSSEKKTQWALE